MNYIHRRSRFCVFLFRTLKPENTPKSVHTIVYSSSVKTSVPNEIKSKNVFYSAIRCKSKKAQYDSDEEEEIHDDDASLARDSKIVKFNTTSLRTDLILKSALGIARNKIEQQFYESKIRVNGKKILKKSASIRMGDEIDVIKMISPKNPNHLYVSRIEILNVAAKDESIAITARRFKNLLIENYEIDPYKGHTENDE